MRARTTAVAAAATAVLATAALGATPQPRLVSATAVGDRVNLTFSAPLAQPPGGAVALSVNGEAVRATRSVVAARRLQLVLPKPVYGDDVVVVSGRNLRAKNRRLVRRFGLTAINRSRPGCTVQPEPAFDAASALPSDRLSVLSVQVDFADAPRGPIGPPAGAIKLSGIDTWIRDLSYGRSRVDGAEHPGSLRMVKNAADYAFSGPWGARKAFFQDIVLSLDGDVDFSRYDAVLVSQTQPRSRPLLEAVAVAPAGSGVVADGKELRYFGATYGWTPSDGLATLLQVAGLRRTSPDYVGIWRGALQGLSPFGKVSLLASDKLRLGWLDPSQVRCVRATLPQPLEVTLAPLGVPGGVKAVLVEQGRGTTLVMENRQRVGLDAAQCRGGMLSYEITTAAHRLRVFPASMLPLDRTCGTLAAAPFEPPRGYTGRVLNVTYDTLDVLPDGSYRLRIRH